MKLFISWSGQRSQQLAVVLRDWFPLMLHFVEPWVSETDISGGERWALEIAKELEKSNFGIICLTRENIESPWILFEAGSLAKSLQDRVIPLLLDLDFSEISGPLAQFQAKKLNSSSMRDVVRSVNQAAANPIDSQKLDPLFEALWQKLDSQLGELPKLIPQPPRRPQHEVLEELVSTVRTMDQRIRNLEGVQAEVESLGRRIELLLERAVRPIESPQLTPEGRKVRLPSVERKPLSGPSVEDTDPWAGLNTKDFGSNE